MLPLLIAAAAGALLGAEKNKEAKDREDKDRMLAAQTQLYSPWTHLQAGPISHANSFVGDVGQGALQGVGMAQGMESADSDTALKNAQIGYFNRGAAGRNPWGQMQ